MADVIGLPSLARLRELEAENARLQTELATAKVEVQRALNVHDVTRIQLHDILATVAAWRKSLDQVEENVRSLMLKLPHE